MIRSYETNRTQGFTIVELIVVIVVIAILAAITAVSYSIVTDQAKQQAVETDAQTIAAQLTKYKSQNGAYPADLSALTDLPGTQSTYQYTYDAGAGTYCLTASVKGASAYVTSGSSLAREGGCPGHGVNGQAPITNLAYEARGTTFALPHTVASWKNNRWTGDGTYSSVTGTTGPVAEITSYARMQFTQAVAAGRGFHIAGNPEVASPGASGFAIEPGKTYTISAYTRSTRTSTGAVNVGIGIRFTDGVNTWLGATVHGTAIAAPVGSPTTNPGPWVRPFVTATAPAGAVRAHAYLRETTAPTHTPGDRIEATGLMITEGSTLYSFADGNSPNWVWTGAASNSTSTGPEL